MQPGTLCHVADTIVAWSSLDNEDELGLLDSDDVVIVINESVLDPLDPDQSLLVLVITRFGLAFARPTALRTLV